MKINYLTQLASVFAAAVFVSCDGDSEPGTSLSVFPGTLEFAAVGETKDLTVEATGTAWTVSSDAGWLAFDPAEGTGSGKVRVTAAPNPTDGERNASVTVNGRGNVEPVTVTVTQSKPYVKSDFFGTYRAQYDKWDLDAKSAFYPVLEDGSFDYDNVITAREFCEAYAAAYNAAENPETPVTAEDCSYNYYDDTRYVRFELTEDKFSMIRYVDVAGGSGISLYDIDGSYVYDAERNAFVIHDTAVEDDPRDITVSVAGFAPGRSLVLAVPDYYWWCALSYDGQTEYLPWVVASYHTEPVQ